jgi:hypothetical protein
MVLVAPRSAKIIEAYGTRVSVLIGQAFVFAAFLWMLIFWKSGIPYWKVGVGYGLMGIGVGLAGPPTSNALTASVPVKRAGMASGTADLQRDFGGAIMQSIFGALLTAGYAATAAAELSGKNVTSSIENTLTKSFSSAADAAKQYPAHAEQIIAGAKTAFLHGSEWAYAAGIIAVLVAATLVFLKFPRHEQEKRLLAGYRDEADAG